MRILLVDDHVLFRDGLGLLLRDLQPDVDVAHAGTVEEALAATTSMRFDLVLLDLALPGRSGFEALEELRRLREDLPVVVLSSSDDRRQVMAAIQAGAMGFVPKSSPAAVMIAALRVVLAGGIYLPPDVGLGADPVASRSSLPTPASLGLTPRQLDVLRLILEGKSIKRMSQAMNTSENTTKTHVAAVLRALGVTTRTQAIVVAHRMGLRLPSP